MNPEEDDQGLSDGERKELESTREALRDVYGTLKEFDEGGAPMPVAAREQLSEAMKSVPKEERVAYDEAMKNCPHLVENESRPELFLRVCSFDPWAAARRICVYWQWRKDLFGDRAFFPMDLSGQGAVSEDIVAAIKCGGSTILPPDSQNRPVFYSDRSRFCKRCGEEDARAKVMFYVLHSLMESDVAVNNGFVIVTKMDSESNNGGKNNTPRSEVVRLLKSGAIPAQLRAVHILVSKRRSLMENVMPLWLKIMGRYKPMAMRTVTHFATSKEAMFADLRNYCFESENIPEELGGTLVFDDYFKQWHSERHKIERKRFHQGVTRPSEESNDSQQQEPENENSRALESLAVAANQVRVEEAKARKRRLDAVYQKRKRQTRKQEFSKITTELNSLKKDNAALKKEQAFLESLHQRAAQVVNVYNRALPTAIQAVPPPVESSVSTRAQTGPANVLNNLANATSGVSRVEPPVGLGSNPTIENLASLVQSGAIPQELLSNPEFLQQLKSTMLLQMKEKNIQQQEQQRRQQVEAAAAFQRLLVAFQQQPKSQRPQNEQSQFARYVQQIGNNRAPAPSDMNFKMIPGYIGQQKQPSHGNMHSPSLMPSVDSRIQQNNEISSAASRLALAIGSGGLIGGSVQPPAPPVAAPVAHAISRAHSYEQASEAMSNDRDKKLELYHTLGKLFQLRN